MVHLLRPHGNIVPARALSPPARKVERSEAHLLRTPLKANAPIPGPKARHEHPPDLRRTRRSIAAVPAPDGRQEVPHAIVDNVDVPGDVFGGAHCWEDGNDCGSELVGRSQLRGEWDEGAGARREVASVLGAEGILNGVGECPKIASNYECAGEREVVSVS